jgi:hypothetical protein
MLNHGVRKRPAAGDPLDLPGRDVERITTCLQFIRFASKHGLRLDWHEPDEQGITARVVGTPLDFDNAMAPGEVYGQWSGVDQMELCVVFSELDEEDGKRVRGRDLAVVNLASLCAWATGGRCHEHE